MMTLILSHVELYDIWFIKNPRYLISNMPTTGGCPSQGITAKSPPLHGE